MRLGVIMANGRQLTAPWWLGSHLLPRQRVRTDAAHDVVLHRHGTGAAPCHGDRTATLRPYRRHRLGTAGLYPDVPVCRCQLLCVGMFLTDTPAPMLDFCLLITLVALLLGVRLLTVGL